MKTVLLTGGSRGIGKAIANRFIEEGYHVVAPSRAELDLASAASVKSFIERNQGLVPHVIINNAGINDVNRLEQVTDEELQRGLQVNLLSPMLLLRGFIPAMKTLGQGWIVNIGSVWGVVSKEGRSVYSAAKHGIHGVTKTLALELAEANILVNTVAPGFTLTELTQKNNTQAQIDNITAIIPMRRMAKPQEIANGVFFLASEQNTYITGQQITVDGGYTCQ